MCACSYWKSTTGLQDLLSVAKETNTAAWRAQKDAGVDLVGLDGTLYDQVLDMIATLGLAPERFKGLADYELYFAMARGVEGAQALDMSKYFNTNYHFLVRILPDSSWLCTGGCVSPDTPRSDTVH